MTLTIPASKLHLHAAGVYLVAATVTVAGVSFGVARTAFAWKANTANAVPLALAAPLTVPASTDTLLSAQTLATDTAPTGILTTQLSDLENSPIAIGIDPRIIASIRILGKTAPQSAIDWLDELSQVSNDTFPLQWADEDVTIALQAGQSSVPQPKSLEYAIDPSRFDAATTTGSTPTPNPTGDTSTEFPLPTSESLTTWNYTIPSVAWPAENTVIATDIPKLERSGLSSAILSSTNLKTTSARQLGSSAKLSSTSVAVSDATLSGYLRTAAAAGTRASWTVAMAELTTSLDLISSESTGTPAIVLATLDRNWSASPARVPETITAGYSRNWVTTSTLSALLGSKQHAVHLAHKPQDEQRVATTMSLLRAERRERQFSIVVSPNEDQLTSPRRLDLLSLLSAEWVPDITGWSSQASSFLTKSHTIIASVEPVATADFQSYSNRQSIPVTIGNELDLPVVIYVEVKPTTTLLSIDPRNRRVKVTIDADSQKRVQIPAQSISNGKAHVTVHLYGSDGRAIGRANTITINVQAGWETIGTAIFAAIVVIVFGVGITRNIRKRRRRGTDADTDLGDDATPTEPATEAVE